jgi:AcrR family transcriptional regulator
MSNKNADKPDKRPYRQKIRAQRREEVHRRITMAAMHLHGSIGPARTTVKDIAEHARVRRATVYNHFPTEMQLLDACSTHWFSENPPPNPTDWVTISDPAKRVEAALEAMYEYYSRGKEMLENVLLDTPQVPALQEILQLKWWPLLERMVAICCQGWSNSGSETGMQSEITRNDAMEDLSGSLEMCAILRVVFSFFTWQTLYESGLSSRKAARLATAWVRRASNRYDES